MVTLKVLSTVRITINLHLQNTFLIPVESATQGDIIIKSRFYIIRIIFIASKPSVQCSKHVTIIVQI